MAQKACKGKTGWVGEQKQDTSGGQARLGQAEEAEEMKYTYRLVLATNKKVICDSDSKTHKDTALKPNILDFQYKRGIIIKTERDFLPMPVVTGQGQMFLN